ncbi:MAG TPA: hypothetical protein VMI31_14930, partial [Fimbriimonadaceae bacterium]|nr:hypothetical protein [Fimbriimonadaceae bacterium]
MNRKQSWNPDLEAIRRGVEGARSEPADPANAGAIVEKMIATPSSRKTWKVPARLATGFAAAAALAVVAFYPRSSDAAPIGKVLAAVQQQLARSEEVLKPDQSGRLYVYFEQWGEGEKYADLFTDGSGELRSNGRLVYCYWNTHGVHYQRVDIGQSVGIDPVGIEAFSQFKLLRTEPAGPHLTRYVYGIHQDLIVDTRTDLPTERVVYNSDGSVMEIHRYHFYRHLPDSVFEPDVKPGVPFYNIPEDRRRLVAMVAEAPQKQVVAGTAVYLYAVIVAHNGEVAALVSGGDPRGTA